MTAELNKKIEKELDYIKNELSEVMRFGYNVNQAFALKPKILDLQIRYSSMPKVQKFCITYWLGRFL